MTIIIGIDPGSRVTGFGIIETVGNKLNHIASGSIKVTKNDSYHHLHEIYIAITDLMLQYHPNEAAIEQVFMHANVNSALKLGQARGAALVAIASQPVKVAEYSARQIKQAVVGYGNAEKAQVQKMVKLLLKLNHELQPDEADALAVAICHSHNRGNERLLLKLK